MRKIFSMLVLLVLWGGLVVLPARAAVVHLDGIANAGWYADDLSKAHLYIADVDVPGAYYYKWTYSPAAPTPLWASRQGLSDDLADGILVNGTVVGNWRVESAGDVFGNPTAPVWKSLNLAPGTYVLRLTPDSRAYQLNAFLWSNESPSASLWNAYVQMYAVYADSTTQSFAFGDWSLHQGAESDVLDYYRQFVDGMTITLPQAAEVYFYINDYNAVDNDAGVSLEFSAVPLPASFLLLAGGLVLLGSRRRW